MKSRIAVLTILTDALISLRVIISLDLKDVLLEEALTFIARKGKLKLNYNRSRIPVDRNVTLRLERIPAGVTRNRIYDSRYILNIMAKYKSAPYWELSAGWIVMGGAPYTPLDVYRSSQAQRGISRSLCRWQTGVSGRG
jgi:hypothetical protein